MNGGKGVVVSGLFVIPVAKMLEHCSRAHMEFNGFVKMFAPCGIKASDNAWVRLGRYVETGSLHEKCAPSKSI